MASITLSLIQHLELPWKFDGIDDAIKTLNTLITTFVTYDMKMQLETLQNMDGGFGITQSPRKDTLKGLEFISQNVSIDSIIDNLQKCIDSLKKFKENESQ